MRSDSEQAEFLGLAAAVGRLMQALKQTEEALTTALAQKIDAERKLEKKEDPEGQ